MSKVVNDLNKALLHIKSKHNGEVPYQYGSRECAKLMDSYAKEYHEHKLKLLDLFSVSDSETITISKKEYDWLKKCEKDLGGIDFSL